MILTYNGLEVLQDIVPLHLRQNGQQLPDRGVRAAGLPVFQHLHRGVHQRLVVLYLQVGEAHGLGQSHPVRRHGVSGVQIKSQLFPETHVQSDQRDRGQVRLWVTARHVVCGSSRFRCLTLVSKKHHRASMSSFKTNFRWPRRRGRDVTEQKVRHAGAEAWFLPRWFQIWCVRRRRHANGPKASTGGTPAPKHVICCLTHFIPSYIYIQIY